MPISKDEPLPDRQIANVVESADSGIGAGYADHQILRWAVIGERVAAEVRGRDYPFQQHGLWLGQGWERCPVQLGRRQVWVVEAERDIPG